MLAGAGTEIDQVVGIADRLFVVFDHDHGIAEVTELLERREQTTIIALMQADAGLIKDVQHADQSRTDLCGQSDALRFTARQRFGAAIECEIIKTDIDEEAQALAYFLENRTGNTGIEAGVTGAAHWNRFEKGERIHHATLDHLPDVEAMHRHGERSGAQSAALARRTRPGHHERLELESHAI